MPTYPPPTMTIRCAAATASKLANLARERHRAGEHPREPWPGQARPEHRRVEPVAAAVAGEHPSGAVRAVGGRGEADDQNAGVRVTEGRDGPAPVALVGEGAAPLGRHLLAPGDEPRAGPADAH